MTGPDANDVFRERGLDPLEREPFDQQEEEGWPDAIPLEFSFGSQPFPVDTLPEWMRRFVTELAEATQTPPDLAGVLVLCSAAAAVQKLVEVEVRPGWRETLSLFGLSVYGVSGCKSAVYAAVTGPMYDYQRERRRVAEPARLRREAELAAKRKKAEAALRKIAADGDREAELEAINAQCEAERLAKKVPVEPTYVVDDATPEFVGRTMCEQGGRIAWFSAEGSTIVDLVAGRYSRGLPNLGVVLRGYSGDHYSLERCGRPSVSTERAHLVLAATVQPDVVFGLGQESKFRGLGFLARVVFAVPASLAGRRRFDSQPVSATATTEYGSRMRCLFSIEQGLGESPDALRVGLSSGATEALRRLHAHTEPTRGPFGRNEAMLDWVGKHEGRVARFAGLLAVSEAVGSLTEPARPAEVIAAIRSVEIDASMMLRAIKIGEWALNHAEAAYGIIEADPAIGEARYLLGSALRHRGKWLGQGGFTRRDAMRWNQRRWRRAGDLDDPLNVLLERSLVRTSGPKPRFTVHPSLELDPTGRPRLRTSSSSESADETSSQGEDEHG